MQISCQNGNGRESKNVSTLSLSVVYSQSTPSPLFTIKLYRCKFTRDYTVWLCEFLNIGSSLENCPDLFVFIILE